jgi:hypothetical protein
MAPLKKKHKLEGAFTDEQAEALIEERSARPGPSRRRAELGRNRRPARAIRFRYELSLNTFDEWTTRRAASLHFL